VSKIRTGFLCIYRYPLSCFYKNKAVVVALCGYRRGHGMEIIFVCRGGVDQLKKVYTKITAELGIMGDFCALADGA
jgi:hypothetical protein